MWLVPHAIHVTQTGAKRLVILSSDTDFMVLALYFNTDLKTNSLSGLWMCAGVGDSTRYIPLHLIFERKPELCSVLPAIHILTGCDTTSKVGTKLLLLNHLLPNCSLNLENHCLAQIKMKLYTKLSNILYMYSNPTVHALLWMILGMKCTTKVKSVISILYHLPVLIYICTF